MSARTPYRKPAKTENVTESQLTRLQKDVDKCNSEIASIQRRIDKHLQQQKDYEMLKQEDEEKLKRVEFIRNILNKYRKEIGMPDPSQQLTPNSKTNSASTPRKNETPVTDLNMPSDADLSPNKTSNALVDYTIYKFDAKRANIDELTESIKRIQEILRNLQSQAMKTKQIIQNINLKIPDLKDDISKLNFDGIFDQTILNKKLYKKIYSIDFYQNDINQRKQTIKQLKNEIQNLQPQKPSMKFVKHPAKNSIVDISPSKEMVKCASFEQKTMQNGMENMKPVLQKAVINRTNNVSQKIKEINSKTNAEHKRLNQLVQKNYKLVTIKSLKPSNNSELIKSKIQQMVQLKERIKANTDKLKEIQTDNPEIRKLSPDGLLKWRNDLLNRIKIESSKYDDDIKKAHIDLKNYKLISDKRIKSLQKMVEEKKGK